jgi:dTDP-4-amino-4,6-dideoxygalactose transaminase
LNLKLKYLKKWNRQRRCIADLYKEGLSGLPLELVEENPLGKSNYHLFVLKTDSRDQLLRYLQTKGISTGIHYPLPIHLTKTFSHLPYKKKSFPVSEKEAKRILSLPIHPFLTEEEIKYVIFEIKNFFGKKYA